MAAAACATEDPGPQAGSAVQIPLSQAAPDGMSTYYLRDASFRITNDFGTDLTVDGGGDEAMVIVPLEPGLYRIELLDGWRMELQAPGQPAEEIGALLASTNPMLALVQPQAPAFASFQFLLGTTEGPLTIVFGVTESWLAYGNMYVSTNEPQPGSTGAFADVPVGSLINFAFHFPQGQTFAWEDPEGVKHRQISMGPIAATFFGGDVIEEEVGPNLTSTYQSVQVAVDAAQVCTVSDTSFYGVYNSEGVQYALVLTDGACVFQFGEDELPQVNHLQLVPQFELLRYDEGVLTDRLTGSLGMIFTTE